MAGQDFKQLYARAPERQMAQLLDSLQKRCLRAETHVFETAVCHTYLFFAEAYTQVVDGFLAGN